MKEFIVDKNEDGYNLHKYLMKILPGAGASLLYKQLRKKNINLNNKKANGNEKLKADDRIQVFFSEETLNKFMNAALAGTETNEKQFVFDFEYPNIHVIHEDEDILVLDKPAGVLTQKGKPSDISLNEEMLSYLMDKGTITADSIKTVKPSVCNRLDRNTSGLVLCGKTIKGLQYLSEILKDRSVHKYYRCVVLGSVTKKERYEAYLTKSESHNQVKITKEAINSQSQYICTEYTPIKEMSISIPGVKEEIKATYLEVLLITGRAHQIRAHLASLKHPLLGDPKYGDITINKLLNRKYKVNRQLLHAYRVEMPNGQVYISPLPKDMEQIIADRNK